MGSNPAAPTNKNSKNSIVKRLTGPGSWGCVVVAFWSHFVKNNHTIATVKSGWLIALTRSDKQVFVPKSAILVYVETRIFTDIKLRRIVDAKKLCSC